MLNVKWVKYFLLLALCLAPSMTRADGRYVKKWVTLDDSTRHGGPDHNFVTGSTVVWEGCEDGKTSTNIKYHRVFYRKGSGSIQEIPPPASSGYSNFAKMMIVSVRGIHVITKAAFSDSGSFNHYLFDLDTEQTVELPSGTVYAALSDTHVFCQIYSSGYYELHKYEISSGLSEKISTTDPTAYMEILDMNCHGDSIAWDWRSSTPGETAVFYHDGSNTVEIADYGYNNFGISLNEDIISFFITGPYSTVTKSSDIYTNVIYNIATETVAENSLFTNLESAIPGYSTKVRMGNYTDIAVDGVVFDVEFSYSSSPDHGAYEHSTGFSGGKYKNLGWGGDSPLQVVFYDGTDYTVISDYGYDSDGVIKLDSDYLDENLPTYTTESYALASSSWSDGLGNLPERWMAHDTACSMGDGVIAYQAYSGYTYIGGFDEIFIYDYENEKHHGMYISDPTRNFAGYVYADPNSRNAAWSVQNLWDYGQQDVAVAYWLGEDAELAYVDLSEEDLSDLDFSNADLTGADLSGADLTGTDFSGATLSGTIFSNAIYDTTTVMPMSFVPGDYEMISFSAPSPLSVELTGISMEGVSYSNSMSNIYVGVEYTQSLTAEWYDAEVQGVILFATNTVGSIPIPIGSIEMPQLFLRLIGATNSIWDSTAYTNPVVQFVQSDYIDLDKIEWISKFRSGMGHDYSDDFESCSSMKHYYQPSVSNWTDVGIYAPVDGTILSIENNEEFGDVTVMIKSDDHPAYKFILFHLQLEPSITNGASVVAGQAIGYHGSNDTISDIAVRISTEDDGILQHRLVSYFDVMTDGLFSNYVARGVSDRSEMIISYEDRTNDMLICSGETFVTNNVIAPGGGYGNITNKVELSTP
mgnify:CR=1 FL=1